MSANQDLINRRNAAVCPGVPRATDITVASASQATLTDLEGNEYIDFAGGIGVLNVGHCDPEVVAAIQDQAAKLIHACIHIATYEPYVALCEKLIELLPHGNESRAMLVNSGAEAVENAVKIARQATGRSAVICYDAAFHGRTLLAATLTSKVGYKICCGPFAPEIYRVPFPNYFRDGKGMTEQEFATKALSRLRATFNDTIAADAVAAIIIELVQGEGGFVVAPPAYVKGLRELCDEHGIMLIVDEVQSGFARTGRWGAYQHYGITPDISTWAKSMGGGMPISAVIGKASVMDRVTTGTIGGTYGGNPVACASALATIEQMKKKDLNKRALQIGRIVRDRLERIAQSVPQLADVRGLGAMVAAEFVEDGDPHKPATDLVRTVLNACVNRGLLIIAAGLHANCIRILSPLVISDAQLNQGLDILEEEIMRHASPASSVSTSATKREVHSS